MSKKIGMLFKTPMVRAILDESKTMTRRLKFHGSIGDLIWVKETFAPRAMTPPNWIYRADFNPPSTVIKWKSSMFMPRRASRITLEVTALRQERLHDITEADAIKEGIEKMAWPDDPSYVAWKNYMFKPNTPSHVIIGYQSPVASFQSLWISINGLDSWILNPLVTVISFRRVK